MNLLGRTIGEIRAALAPMRKVLTPLIAISSVYNILLLAGSFFMLLVYDDVLPSRSVPSLISLIVMVVIAYGFQAFLDVIRGRVMVHVGTLFSRRLSDRVLDVISRFELLRGPLPAGTQIVRDIDTIRSFLSGPGPLAFLDLPWIFVYLLILFIFHWSLGVLALVGVLILVALMLFNGRLTDPLAHEVVRAASNRFQLAETTHRNAESIKALGMSGARRQMWLGAEDELLRANERLFFISTNFSGITKAFRMLLQSASLGLGAYLVITGSASGGVIIAASILTARAAAPVEQVIGHWKSMISSRQAQARLIQQLEVVPAIEEPMGLDLPRNNLTLSQVTTGPPGARVVTAGDVSFRLEAGDALAIVGPSGSGKTALARAICGVWPLLRGSVRLDGATLDQWSSDQIADIVGYVPQAIELFEGSIAQNIARFRPDADREAVLAAARAADCHDMIVRLPDGYDYRLDPRGGNLSAGQQQRIALARALYGDPFLIVLDEPNSNLDYDGEVALGVAVRRARERGAIAIVIAHRPQIVSHVSHIMVMNSGRVESFQTREEFEERKRQRQAQQITASGTGAAASNAPPAANGAIARGAAKPALAAAAATTAAATAAATAGEDRPERGGGDHEGSKNEKAGGNA